MQSLNDNGVLKVRTAYGFKTPSAVNYIERAEIISKVNSCLSIRGKDPVEFSSKLDELIKQYEE